MAVSNGPNLVLMEDAADGDVHGNDMRKFMRWMDSLVQGSVISATVTAQPLRSPMNVLRSAASFCVCALALADRSNRTLSPGGAAAAAAAAACGR